MTESFPTLFTTFTDLALRLSTRSTPAETLAEIAAVAVTTVDGAEQASLTLRRRSDRGYQTVASTGDLALRVDKIQYQVGDGPCINALTEHHVLVTGDLATDPRWPDFARRATEETPVVSMLAHRLNLEEDTSLASLNLYSTQPNAFIDVDPDVLNSLATLSAIALAKSQAETDRDNLQQALNSNRRIGMAVGILMLTYRVTEDEAFTYLRLASQQRHIKLALIADDVIHTGELKIPD